MNLSSFEWIIITAVGGILFAVVGYFLKRTMSQTDKNTEDINHIKQTYVCKEELKEVRGEWRSELKQLLDDVNEIKDKVLYKEDFYRSIVDLQRSVESLRKLMLEKGGKP